MSCETTTRQTGRGEARPGVVLGVPSQLSLRGSGLQLPRGRPGRAVPPSTQPRPVRVSVSADRRLSARDAEKLLGIPASTVRTWYQRTARTCLRPVDFQRGKPRFRESDLTRLRQGKRQLQARPSPRHGEYGRYLSARDAEKILGIPASTVATWYHRKERTQLYPLGHDNNGNPIFYEADLIVLTRGLQIRDEESERAYTMSDLA